MKCLHICNDLLHSKVHENLYDNLARLDLDQTIYYPVRQHTIEKTMAYKASTELDIVASKPLKKWHRILFRQKINYLYKDLKSKISLKDYDVVHATTLFSDGALALKIYKEYKIPYIIAIRSTDITLFLRYRKDLHFLAAQILKNASSISFISKSSERNFFNQSFAKKNASGFADKIKIICNGVDAFWLENKRKRQNVVPHKLLFIGKFDTNKNVLRLLKAVLLLRDKIPGIKIDMVGSGGDELDEIIALSKEYSETIEYHGPVYDKEELMKLYRSSHVFTMISNYETFGLVYVEALTQGLPILYTKNQGIDGTFVEKVGEAVDSKSVASICDGLIKLLTDYTSYLTEEVSFSRFDWELISLEYMALYRASIGKIK